MSARNRKLPRHRAWPLTTTDITGCLGPYMSRVTDLRFLTGPDSGTIVLGAEWVAPIHRNYGRSMHLDMVGSALTSTRSMLLNVPPPALFYGRRPSSSSTNGSRRRSPLARPGN